VALQVLYAVDLSGQGGSGSQLGTDEAFDLVSENFELPEGARAFAKELLNGVVQHREELDALIAAHATNWRISRMAAVDRNILRIGAYELVHTDTPKQVILDEAVELARRFGDDPSPAFVNGVLDAVGRAVARDAAATSGAPGEPAEEVR